MSVWLGNCGPEELEGGKSAPHTTSSRQHMRLGTGLEVLNGLEEDVCVVKGRTRLTMNSEKTGGWFRGHDSTRHQ